MSKFEDGLHSMFDTIWDCDINHPIFQDTVGELMEAVIQCYNSSIKHGKWVKIPGYATPGGDPVWGCSECGKGIHVYGIEHGSYGSDISDGQWVACPNCGALMDD